MKNFDIIIVGKTVSGLALACGLPRNFKVAILNNKCRHQYLNIDRLSISTISIAVSYLLRFLKIWDNCVVQATSYYAVDIREEDSFNNLFFDKPYLGYPCLGYIIDSSIIYKLLLSRMYAFDNIYFIDNVNCSKTTIIDREDSLCVMVNQENCLLTKLLVVTDNCEFLLNKDLGVPVTFWHSPYNVLLGTIYSDYPHKNVIRYIFQKRNVLTLLPLMSPNVSFVFWLLFSDSSDNSFSTSIVDKVYWNDLFMQSFNVLGKVNFAKNVNIFPCISQYSRMSPINRLLLLGHAAYDISPFKYQNINFDLMDVAILLGKIYKSEKNIHIDLGNDIYLRSYEKDRFYRMIKMFGKIQCMRAFFSGTDFFSYYVRAAIFQIIRKTLPIIYSSDIIHSIIGFDHIPSWLLTGCLDD